jgi:Protein DA1
MDTAECQPLYLDIREFYEGLNMKIYQQIPLLLVEREALNEALEGEKTVRMWTYLFVMYTSGYHEDDLIDDK